MMTPDLYDLNSAAGVRQIVAALFLGYNYRRYTEGQTRHQLLAAYESNARQTAENSQVCFIQIRNNRTLTEMYGFLKERVGQILAEPPADADGIRAAVSGLPDAVFTGAAPAP